MKSIIFTFGLFFFSATCFAAGGQPILPNNSNGYDTVAVRKFFMQQTDLSYNWGTELVRLVNKALIAAGKKGDLRFANVCWIVKNTRYEVVEVENFINSYRKDSKIIFFTDDYYLGEVAFLTYDGVRIPLYKTSCLNLVHFSTRQPVTQTAPPAEEKKEPEKKPEPEPCKQCFWAWNCETHQKEFQHNHPNWMKCCDLVQIGGDCPPCPKPARETWAGYSTQGAYRIGGYCPPPVTYCAPPAPRCQPRPRCEPRPQPRCNNTYYGSRRTGR